MKIAAHALLMVISLSLLVSAFDPVQDDAERAVRKLERAWLDAYENHDAKAMDEIVGEEFFIVFPDGAKQTKPQLMEQIRRSAGMPKGLMRFHTEDVKARVSGDTVVLTGRVITERMSGEKVTSSDSSLYRDTYKKRGGRWQVIESHLATKADPE